VRYAPLFVALDYGIKVNILSRLVATGFGVVLPASSTAAEILATIRLGFYSVQRTGGIPRALPYAYRAIGGRARKNLSSESGVVINCWDWRLGGKPPSSDFGVIMRDHPVRSCGRRRWK